MLKKLWNISDVSRPTPECGRAKEEKQMTLFGSSALFCLLSSVVCVLVLSCTPKKEIVIPTHEGVKLEQAMNDLRQVKILDATLSVDYEKSDTIMSGDAALTLSSDELSLRIYYLGFLAGEVKEEKGEIRSRPKLDKSRSTMLVTGLRNGFFWWDIRDYTITEDPEQYVLKNSDREILVSKKLLLPTQQVLRLPNSDELIITYDTPEQIEETDRKPGTPAWMHYYQSQMKIELKRSLVKVKVKSYIIQ